MRRLALLIFALSLFAVPATANAAVSGGLKQLGSTSGCLSGEASPPADCTAVRGLGTSIGEAAMTKDGKQVYVTSRDKDAIVLFDRNASTGKLTQKSSILGCFTTNATTQGSDGCSLVSATASILDQADAIAISPDGQSVYTTTQQGVFAFFSRASDGTLTFQQQISLGFGGGADKTFPAITVSPDGKNVYLAGPGSFNGMLWIVTRDTSAGATHGQISTLDCINSVSSCSRQVPNMQLPSDMVVTPDNKQLIVASGETQGAVIAFDRSTTNGDLNATAANTATRCITGNSSLGNCTFRSGTDYPRGVTVVGNRDIYVRGYFAQTVVRRNASTNALSAQPGSQFCATYDTSGFTGCTFNRDCTVFCGGRGVFATPDGQNVFDGNESSGTVFGLRRNANDGSLAFNTTPLGCLTISQVVGCNRLRQGTATRTVVGDDKFVYAAGGPRIFAFAIDHPPVCNNVSANTTSNVSVVVSLSCSDPDGDGLTFEKVTDPARGTLAGIQGNNVSYGPQPGTTGADSFTYRAVGAGVASDPATATINVSQPPPPPPPPGGGGGTLTVLPSTTSINSLAFRKFTKLVNLSAKNLQAGSTVTVTCKTKKKKQQKKGCAYKKKRFTTSGARAKLNLVKPFKKKKIPVGTKITITITAPGFLGKRITYTVRARKLPKSKVQCLSASGKAGSCA